MASATLAGGTGRGQRRSYGAPRRAKKPVSTGPGSTQDTVTPAGRTSARSASQNARTAAFEAE